MAVSMDGTADDGQRLDPIYAGLTLTADLAFRR